MHWLDRLTPKALAVGTVGTCATYATSGNPTGASGCAKSASADVFAHPEDLGDKLTSFGRDLVLASPVILYDFPAVAPQSPGDFFDGPRSTRC